MLAARLFCGSGFCFCSKIEIRSDIGLLPDWLNRGADILNFLIKYFLFLLLSLFHLFYLHRCLFAGSQYALLYELRAIDNIIHKTTKNTWLWKKLFAEDNADEVVDWDGKLQMYLIGLNLNILLKATYF
jgi:hypothetical protein